MHISPPPLTAAVRVVATVSLAYSWLMRQRRKPPQGAWLRLRGLTCSSRPGTPRCRLSLIHLWSSSPGPVCRQWGMPTPSATAEPTLDGLYLAQSGAQVWMPRVRPLRQSVTNSRSLSKQAVRKWMRWVACPRLQQDHSSRQLTAASHRSDTLTWHEGPAEHYKPSHPAA